ncbi:MAG TPA: glycosyltransferase [Blastocatellia bacterium]|nr:glycosyltransferase [Blastocatellia bacterium]
MSGVGAQNRSVRVVRIIDRLNIGGPAKHVTWLSSGLDPQEFETVLITGTIPPGEGDMSYFAREAGISPVIVKEMSRELGLRDLLVIAKLLGHLRRIKPDIVHTHKAKAGAAGRIAATLYRWMTPSALWLRTRPCRIVHTFHGHIFHSYYGPAKTGIFIAIERVLSRLTDRIITISEQQRREINEVFRIGRASQFEVIPLGIDLEEFSGRGGRLREELGAGDKELLVGIVGRLSEVKNHAMLLEAMARISRSESGSSTRLVIIGDGHLRPDLEALAARLGISGQVAFTGFRKDAASLYQDLDIVALTSLNEGTPLTLIEAMACGRAVATTEVGGVVDIMGARRERREGFTVWDHGVTAPSQDVEAFSRALQYLIERAGERREMGERGRAFVRARLSRERLLRDVARLYRDLIEEIKK